MKRKTIRQIHVFAAIASTLCIATFWLSSIVSELFLSHAGVTIVKISILYALFFFIPMMMTTGITGMKLAGKSKNPLILKKKKRMPIIALNGMLILLPCAIFLSSWARAGQFDFTFYAIQILELCAGALNLTLMGMSMRDGRQLAG